MSSGGPFDYVALLLLLLYSLQFLLGGYQLHLSLFRERRNKRLTIRNGIVSILTIAALLRIIFWLKACIPTTVNEAFGLVIFFLPLWLNFAGLSLLVLFYAQAVAITPSNTPAYVCFTANSLLFLGNLIIGGEMATKNLTSTAQSNVAYAYAVYGSFLDFSLAILLGIYGYRFKNDSSRRVLTTRILPNSLLIFDFVNWVIIITYIIRGSFSAIVASDKVLPSGEGDVQFNGQHPVTSITIFVFFTLCEIVPSVCVLAMLWRVAQSQHSKRNNHETGSQSPSRGGQFDTRLLSAEDAKVKVFLAAAADGDERQTASLEDPEEAPHGYLIFEDMSLSPFQEGSNFTVNSRLLDEGSMYSPPRPIPSIASFKSLSPLSSSSGGNPTPDITTHIFIGEHSRPVDGSAVIHVPSSSAGGDKYADFVSPRDILLHSSNSGEKGRRGSGNGKA